MSEHENSMTLKEPKRSMKEIAEGFAVIVGSSGKVSHTEKCIVIETGSTAMRMYRDVNDPDKYFLLDGMSNAVSHQLWYWNEVLLTMFSKSSKPES